MDHRRRCQGVVGEPLGVIEGRLVARGGRSAKKKAVIAVARKLAVLMHRLWLRGPRLEAKSIFDAVLDRLVGWADRLTRVHVGDRQRIEDAVMEAFDSGEF